MYLSVLHIRSGLQTSSLPGPPVVLLRCTTRPLDGHHHGCTYCLISVQPFCALSSVDYQGTKMRQKAEQRHVPGASGTEETSANILTVMMSMVNVTILGELTCPIYV